jgi:ABC-type Zn uptake system ZnuABC Zn-binding protein ZnuA
VQLGDEVLPRDEWIFDRSFPEADGKPNPHLWTDPTYVQAYADVVLDTLVDVDPDGEAAYRERRASFGQALDGVDAAMRAAFATIDPGDRKLLTYHDAYAYFARSYGFEVIGAIQVSDFEEPSPGELASVIDQIDAEGVEAIFGSEVFPSPVLEQLARETGVVYVDDLRDDDLPGKPGDPEHSLLGLLRFNFATITEALGGEAGALAALELAAADDRAVYPQ